MYTQINSRIVASVMMFSMSIITLSVSAQDSPPFQNAAQQINAANKLVRKGEFDNAIKEFGQVSAPDKDRDLLNYNLAVAQFRQGDLAAAESRFTDSVNSLDSSIAANSRYNLGNCSYSRALQFAKSNRPAAIEQLQNAISHYRGSLQINADNSDARANIELAAELVKQLREEEKQEKKDQEKQNEGQQQSDQSSDESSPGTDSPSQNESSEADKSEPNSDSNSNSAPAENESRDPSDEADPSHQNSTPKSNSDRTESDKSEQRESSDDQTQPHDQSESSSDSGESKSNPSQAQPSQDNPARQEPSGSKQDSSENQQPSDSDQQNPDSRSSLQPAQPKGADGTRQSESNQQSAIDQQLPDQQTGDEGESEGKEIPAGELKSAGEQADQSKNVGSYLNEDPNAQNRMMTKEEAMKMLQAVRDRDMLRRLRQQQIERARRIPVDRDW